LHISAEERPSGDKTKIKYPYIIPEIEIRDIRTGSHYDGSQKQM